MNELHKAFTALGLEPGAPFETVKRRYRRLALVWHPDRMTNAEAKREAEEELKKINNSFDKLKKHFETEHKSGPSCRCQPAVAGPPPNNNNSQSGPNPSDKKRQQEEAERKRNTDREAEAARKRNEERQRQADAEEAAQRASEAASRAQDKQRATDDAIKSEALRKQEVLRWKCAAAVALTFIGLLFYCWVGCAVRDGAHAISQQWEKFQLQFKPKDQNPVPPKQQPAIRPTQPSASPYIPPYERYPGGNPTAWRQFHDEQEQRRKLDEENQRKQDIYFAKLQVDRAQKAIDHCSHDIAQMELKIADPFVSDFEKNKIREFRDFQQRNLETAQAELRDAQDKLRQLGDTSWLYAPPAPPPNS